MAKYAYCKKHGTREDLCDLCAAEEDPPPTPRELIVQCTSDMQERTEGRGVLLRDLMREVGSRDSTMTILEFDEVLGSLVEDTVVTCRRIGDLPFHQYLFSSH